MPERIVRATQVRAVRLIRAGSAPAEVCQTLRLRPESVKALELECRNVPDDFLARLERLLSANEKLRRLVAGLGAPLRRGEADVLRNA